MCQTLYLYLNLTAVLMQSHLIDDGSEVWRAELTSSRHIVTLAPLKGGLASLPLEPRLRPLPTASLSQLGSWELS